MDLQRCFEDSMKNSLDFQEAYKIVSENSSGNLWVVGGFIFRNLISRLYKNNCLSSPDFDFVVEKPIDNLAWPEDWGVSTNKCGDPRIRKQEKVIDYIPLQSVFRNSVGKSRNYCGGIEGYLIGVPLTIQSIAYNLKENKLIGKIGINSILTKTIKINDIEEAEQVAKRKGISLREYVEMTANQLDFIPEI